MTPAQVLSKILPSTAPTSGHDYLNALLADAGVSRTVYSYVMPETQVALDELLDADRRGLHNMYTEAWTQKQDALHIEFFDTWKSWSAPVVKLRAKDFPFVYTTAGASEALRETIYAYAHEAHVAGFIPAIHVFDTDYEGFSAFAEAAAIHVVRHDRATWRQSMGRIGPNDQFYLSQPSAIDGNVWEDYNAFVKELQALQPTARLMVDLTYVGCVARDFKIDVTAPNIAAVFFSLSKPMGVYYHRIGGLLSRKAYPGLFGNRWFKNLLSLKFGTLLMRKFGVQELPKKYAASAQAPAIREVSARLKLDLQPADVWLLATGKPSTPITDLERYLIRGGKETGHLRLCLTPTIARIINPFANGVVTARPHESLTPEVAT